MPSFKKTLKIKTDKNGNYSTFQKVEPPKVPDFLGFTIEVKARLLSPTDITVSGIVDIDAIDGNPQNTARNFQLSVEQVSLGEWKLDGGDHIFMASGQTSPTRPNTELEIEVEGVV